MQDVVCQGMGSSDATRPFSDRPGAVHRLLPSPAHLQPYYTRIDAACAMLSYGLQYHCTHRQSSYGQGECTDFLFGWNFWYTWPPAICSIGWFIC